MDTREHTLGVDTTEALQDQLEDAQQALETLDHAWNRARVLDTRSMRNVDHAEAAVWDELQRLHRMIGDLL
jgi:hypothetical protein